MSVSIPEQCDGVDLIPVCRFGGPPKIKKERKNERKKERKTEGVRSQTGRGSGVYCTSEARFSQATM